MPEVQQVIATPLSDSSHEPIESPRLAPELAAGDFLFPPAAPASGALDLDALLATLADLRASRDAGAINRYYANRYNYSEAPIRQSDVDWALAQIAHRAQ